MVGLLLFMIVSIFTAMPHYIRYVILSFHVCLASPQYLYKIQVILIRKGIPNKLFFLYASDSFVCPRGHCIGKSR